MITQQNIDSILSGRGNVLDSQGNKIGAVGQIYLDDQTGDPSWVTVKTGLFGTSESFVPLEGVNVDGNDVTVRYTKDQVKDAPRTEADGSLSPEEEEQLYRHYGLAGGRQDTTTQNTTTAPP
uniref:PRC-barrel domain-containing protein n=1 Tax=Arthrobacter sp. H41 TaxID=1312978 RepID=UPI00047CDCCC